VTDALYVETSAALRILLEGDRALGAALGAADRLVTSELTLVEADRSLRRARRDGRLGARELARANRWLAAFARSSDLLALDAEVLDGARRDFPVEPVRALDALHLASILVWEAEVGSAIVVSCDQRVRDNAIELGFEVLPAPDPG
jgi:hypothetical protein